VLLHVLDSASLLVPWYGGLAGYHEVIGALAHQPHEAHAGRQLLAAQAQAEVVAAVWLIEEALEPLEQRGAACSRSMLISRRGGMPGSNSPP
jgi:predicted short-subunit dehydrogenase-like oxidoreductase (DUF2520 family)